jgi:hypothetical protein
MKVTGSGERGHLAVGSPGIAFLVYGWQECAMLTKCANPECFEGFRFLDQRKAFCLSPNPDLQTENRTRSRARRGAQGRLV